ncbi:hypothetical protein Tsubulata_005010 [Turnera subulata]|uniref:Syntaxin 6/10/61 N-terminal domain-containing protein n=1 Tax=Turnera subulata TaxID=218843 RepID=A0A9Q0J3F9_9ROSI|nr:hypothetical protein Tsubulata_005010 [Turnera subulata]
MMVVNSFDLWQKDAFFSAAEEVQESADVMESAYRMWIRERREESRPEVLDELSRELQTTLGTAKWQLEEFEKAVRLSHGHRYDDISASRHKQFVAAIESQIARVEASLTEAFSVEGKQPLRWVDLDEEECDDLAMFLSGTTQTPQIAKAECIPLRSSTTNSPGEMHSKRKDADHNSYTSGSCGRGISDAKDNLEFVIDVEDSGSPGTSSDIICQGDKVFGSRKTWSSPNFGSLKIVIADEDERGKLVSTSEATPKEKGSSFSLRLVGSTGSYKLPFNCSSLVPSSLLLL